jgi:hypothetical protein
MVEQCARNPNSICVLGGVSSRGILGPFFFPSTVTGSSFCKVMEEEMLPDILEKYGDEDVWLQMDGVPGHWATQVREWTDGHFPGRWIGRGGPVPWPPRSPDLTPPDFF